MKRVLHREGRDHYPRAWTTSLAGGDIRGGQTIGRTDAQGAEVVDRPISVVDFMATVCHLLDIDYHKELVTPNGLPIRIVDKDESVIEELLN